MQREDRERRERYAGGPAAVETEQERRSRHARYSMSAYDKPKETTAEQKATYEQARSAKQGPARGKERKAAHEAILKSTWRQAGGRKIDIAGFKAPEAPKEPALGRRRQRTCK